MSVRIAFLSDSHFHDRNRFVETQRVHDWIFNDAIKRGCDIMVHGGDLFDRKATTVELEAAMRWVRHVCAMMPLVMVQGNHDHRADLDWVMREVFQSTATQPVWPFLFYAGPRVEGTIVKTAAGPLGLVTLPWQRPLEQPGKPTMAAEERERIRRQIIDTKMPSSVPTVLISHAMVRAAPLTTEDPTDAVELELEDLCLEHPRAVLLGHIHAHQHWNVGGVPVLYPGTSQRRRFSDLEPKGYIVLDVDVWNPETEWGQVRTPLAPQHHIEWCAREGVPDVGTLGAADIRLRYFYRDDVDKTAGALQAADLARRLKRQGAVHIETEPVEGEP